MIQQFKCFPGNSTKMFIRNCTMKKAGRIGSDRMMLNVQTTIVQPLSAMHVHFMVFYKYQVFKIFPINLWDDICIWLNKKKHSFLVEIGMARILEFVKYDHRLECPFEPGNLSVSFKNISINEKLPLVPLVPSGKFKMDFTLTEPDRNAVIVRIQIFLTVSDTRIEQY